MAIKRVNPTSAGRRFQTYSGFDEITKKTPEKSLIKMLKKSGGRKIKNQGDSHKSQAKKKNLYQKYGWAFAQTNSAEKPAAREKIKNRS